MDRKIKSRKYIKIITVLAILLFVFGFACIPVCGLLRDNGYGDFWWPLVGVTGFLLGSIISLILLFSIFESAISVEIDDKNHKYDTAELGRLKGISRSNVREQLVEIHKFKETEDGYWRKKVFSFMKDSICYYAKCVSSSNVETTLVEELELIDKVDEKTKNVCFLLFIYKENINDDDRKQLREIAKYFIIRETVVPVNNVYSCVAVLVNQVTNEGCFLDIGSAMSISVYAHGCKLIKKISLKDLK